MTNEEIIKKIEKLKQELNDIKSNKKVVQECEIWSRCVGYFRPIKDFNEGKLAEFHDRINYEV
jgi:anaerobic ribonucleoside-triphosphate reductase